MQKEILHNTQFFLEVSTTLETPFILKNADVFIQTGYAYGIKTMDRIKGENYILELDQTQRYSSKNRVSYFNASVGFQFNFLDIKKATSK